MRPAERPMKGFHSATGGFSLVVVLVITAVGLLFGAGALLLFRYQCQMRIDRQHELEKVYAVRSVLNYMRTYIGEVSEGGKLFDYHTESGRDLRLVAKPVAPIFPVDVNCHYFLRNGQFTEDASQYSIARDYEYGAVGYGNTGMITNGVIRQGVNDKGWYLKFCDVAATNTTGTAGNMKWWVNIGMRGTGGWLQEDYGRRYDFSPIDYVDGNTVKDEMRLCIIRNVTNALNDVGCRHGWPLSKSGERAIVFQVSPRAGAQDDVNAVMTVWEYAYGRDPKMLLSFENCPSMCQMGLQLAENMVSVYYIGNAKANTDAAKEESRGYTFLGSTQISQETYKYFSETVVIGGTEYCGIYTNDADHKVYAPELRAVLEVEGASDKRAGGNSVGPNDNTDSVANFRVTPAYQYDIFLEYPPGVTNRATVAQKIGKYQRGGLNYTLLTYDTHGTDNKGFRKDERDHAGRGGK